LARESDEEKPKEDKKEAKPGKPEMKAEAVAIDFDGIDQRILALPEPAGNYHSLQAGAAGQIFYLDAPEAPAAGPRGSTLKRSDLAKRKSEAVLPGAAAFQLTPDGKKALVLAPPESWSIVDVAAGTPAPGKGKLNLDAVEVRIDPRAEWEE